MRKLLSLFLIIIASMNVCGMNIRHDQGFCSSKKNFLHFIRKNDRSTLAKRSSRHLGILNKRYLKLSMQNNILKQENSILTQLIQKDMDVDQLRPSDIEKLEQKITILSDRVQNEKHLKIDNQKQIEDLKTKLENANLDLDVTKLNLDAKQRELVEAKRELAETKEKLAEVMRRLERATFTQNNGSTLKNFNVFF